MKKRRKQSCVLLRWFIPVWMQKHGGVKKNGKSVFGYKQHTLFDNNGLVLAVETTAANQHDGKPLLTLLDKAEIEPGTRIHADKAYCSQKHREALKARGIKMASRIRQ